jgi:hypothetical protein
LGRQSFTIQTELLNELEQAKPTVSEIVQTEPSLLLSNHSSCCEVLALLARRAGTDCSAVLKDHKLLLQTAAWQGLNSIDQLLLLALPQNAEVVDMPV